MPINKKKYYKIAIHLIVLAILMLAAGYFLLQAQSHRKYLQSFSGAQQITANMPIGFVVRHFNLSEQMVFAEVNLPVNRWNGRYTLSEACQKKHLDCVAVVDNLNAKIIK